MNTQPAKRFVSTNAVLPRLPGTYQCKVKTGDDISIHAVEYVTLSDQNLDWDLSDYPEGTEVIAFRKIKPKQ